MRQITEEQVQNILVMEFVLPVIKEAYEDCVEGKIYAGNRIFMPIRGEKNVGQW
ncbi:MAG: ornithine cyclodeaminase family protein, partial [Neobacillus sp.]|nr:ornithine cyclodeaminase family protein [Neobacillus sp.]